MSKRVNRPSPSMAVACLALFVALGGTGYAAVQINGKNIKNGTVTAAKLKQKTITGAKIKNDTLTGLQIKESTLGKVPSAARADNAAAAATAATAANATNAANAADAAKLQGQTAAQVREPAFWGKITAAGTFGADSAKGVVSITESPTIPDGGYCIDLDSAVKVAVASGDFGNDTTVTTYAGAAPLVCGDGTDLTVLTIDISAGNYTDRAFSFIAY